MMNKRTLNKRYVLMLRWGVPSAIATISLCALVVVASVRRDPATPNDDGSIDGLTDVLTRTVSDDMVRFSFEDVTAKSGIVFQHFPAQRSSLLPEDMGSGVAWGDYDDDGDPDLFCVNFAGPVMEAIDPASPHGRCSLYRNDGGVFTDVAAETGLDAKVFGLGAAWGDYDDDDDLDLFVTCYGPNRLYRNDGDQGFVDVTASAGVEDVGFGAGCAWGDYDGDGHIDLYVCNYVDFNYREGDGESLITRQYAPEIPFTINPSSYAPAPNRLYRNKGDGTFVECALVSGVANPSGRSLEAVWFDFDGDDRLDLYVANDISANGVFLNMGDGSFADIGASSLAADYRGAMGLAVGDCDHDGDLDLFVTHWVAQENAYFENKAADGWKDGEGRPKLVFMDNAEMLGLGYTSLKMVGWATGFVDFDNDAHLDLWVVNGSTMQMADDPTRLVPQRTQLFRNKGGAGFYDVTDRACAALSEPMVGRGGAYADYDGDGRVDAVIAVHGGSPRLLQNTTTGDNHWIRTRLRQSGRNTRALGARVSVRVGEMTHTAQVGADGSYLSQHAIDLHFGLGAAGIADEITIRWPDGTVERRANVSANQVVDFHHAVSTRSAG